MDKKKAEELLAKYLNNDCTPEEKLLVESWYNAAMDQREQEPQQGIPDFKRLKHEIYNGLPLSDKRATRKLWYSYAASLVLIMLFTTLYFYADRRSTPETTNLVFDNNITPGGNIAVLTLADGSKIRLDQTHEGMLAVQSNTDVVKLDSGQLAYRTRKDPLSNMVPVYNTLETPRGGQYMIILPDGTRAWLNAASSITYPVVFTSGKRIVEITGEVYFEVTPDKSRPFLVRSGSQEVQVLGTRFNISAYQDEASIRTTLIEGSVRVSGFSADASLLLAPGQQAALKDNVLSVKDVDIERAVAWKNGYFMFVNDENIRSIMREVARWYDVELGYEGNMEEVNFTGTVSRFENVSVLLEKLQLTGMVKFKIEGRKVTVINNETSKL